MFPPPTKVTVFGPVGGGGLTIDEPVPEPVAPLNMPVPPEMVMVAVVTCTPFWSGGPKLTNSFPKGIHSTVE